MTEGIVNRVTIWKMSDYDAANIFMTAVEMQNMQNGLVVVAKRDCPTCVLIEPVLAALAGGSEVLSVISQDDPGFPGTINGVIDDRQLEASYHLDIETVPTMVSNVSTIRVITITDPSSFINTENVLFMRYSSFSFSPNACCNAGSLLRF